MPDQVRGASDQPPKRCATAGDAPVAPVTCSLPYRRGPFEVWQQRYCTFSSLTNTSLRGSLQEGAILRLWNLAAPKKTAARNRFVELLTESRYAARKRISGKASLVSLKDPSVVYAEVECVEWIYFWSGIVEACVFVVSLLFLRNRSRARRWIRA
jgi:hypothetical protein